AAEGVIATISTEAIKDDGGAILAELSDDYDDFVLLYHQQVADQFPDVTVHHWVLDAQTGRVFFADTKHGHYQAVTTHAIRHPESFDAWVEMALRYATSTQRPSAPWNRHVDHTAVSIGDTMMREVQLPTGTTIAVQGTVAAISVSHEQGEQRPTIFSSSGAILCGTADELTDSTVTIWHRPRKISANAASKHDNEQMSDKVNGPTNQTALLAHQDQHLAPIHHGAVAPSHRSVQRGGGHKASH